jgi:hypothetical protein
MIQPVTPTRAKAFSAATITFVYSGMRLMQAELDQHQHQESDPQNGHANPPMMTVTPGSAAGSAH